MKETVKHALVGGRITIGSATGWGLVTGLIGFLNLAVLKIVQKLGRQYGSRLL